MSRRGEQGADYFVSGGGGEHKGEAHNALVQGGWVSAEPGFLSVTLDALNEQATFRFLGAGGRELYRVPS